MSMEKALAAAGQGLGEAWQYQAQREMREIMFMREENLAYLRNGLEYQRQAQLQKNAGAMHQQRDQARLAEEHSYRDEEINRQNAGRGANQQAAQSRAFAHEDTARNGAERAQAWRQTVQERERAGQLMTTLRGQIMTRLHQLGADGGTTNAVSQSLSLPNGAQSNPSPSSGGAPAASGADRLKAFMVDPVLNGAMQQYRDAYGRYNAANATLSTMPQRAAAGSTDSGLGSNGQPPLIPHDSTSFGSQGTDISATPYDAPPADEGSDADPGDDPEDYQAAVDPSATGGM